NILSSSGLRKSAYQLAKGGGKHSGWLRPYLNKTVSEIKRGIKSLEKNIKEHENLIKDPKKYWKIYNKHKKSGKDWDDLDPREQKALLERVWKRHLDTNREQKNILEGLLKEKTK